MIVAIMALPVASLSAYADEGTLSSDTVVSDVHGVSYRDTTSVVWVAVLPDTASAYRNIDWYVYYTGTVSVFVNGELVDTIESEGLTKLVRSYEEREHYTVAFIMEESSFVFAFTVRPTIALDGEEAPGNNNITMTETEYTLGIFISYVLGAVCIIIPFWFAYKRRRKQSRLEEKVL